MWTEERVELLKKLWGDGLSASQVAKQLGGVTRNAVIGKVHRLGLSGRATPSRASRPRTQAPRPSVAHASATGIRAAGGSSPVRDTEKLTAALPDPIHKQDLVPLEPGAGATVLTLTEHTCKWPIGDPGTEEFHFCGRRADAAVPYCVEHAKLAYQPVQPRRNRDRSARSKFAS